MKITTNLLSRTYLDHRTINRWMMLVGAVLIALLGVSIMRVSWDWGEISRLKKDISSMEEKLNRVPGGVSQKDYQKLLSDITFFNGVIERKSLDWLGLLNRLEQTATDGISLSGITPDPQKGEVKLEGRAKTFDNVVRYLKSLEESRLFTNVMLLSHKELTAGVSQRGIQFSVTCRTVFR